MQRNRGKTRDLFKKTGDTKGTLHAEMGSIKDRNGMDRTEGNMAVSTNLNIILLYNSVTMPLKFT